MDVFPTRKIVRGRLIFTNLKTEKRMKKSLLCYITKKHFCHQQREMNMVTYSCLFYKYCTFLMKMKWSIA